MKVSFLIVGILLIIGATIDYFVTPKIMDDVNSITNSLETNILPTVDNTQLDSAYASNLSDVNSKIVQLNSGMGMMEKVSEYSSWVTAVAGIGMVLYGVFAKNNGNQKSQSTMYNSEALEILKKRLAKGEITKKEFNNIKQDIR